LNTSEPLVQEYYTSLNLVTTLPSLADPCSEKDAGVYFAQGKKFEFVGPLLEAPPVPEAMNPEEMSKLFQDIKEAKAAGKEIVYVSMGTVLTGNHEEYGWNGRAGDTALTGKELCHGVFGAVFKELGKSDGKAGPLVILAVGPQPDALPFEAPPNCRCFPTLPQVELLQCAQDALAFSVTHGGQNSFMECLSVASPLLVCPGFGDQQSNAARAEALKLGVKVDRPKTGDDGAMEAYGMAVSKALQTMCSSKDIYHAAARTLAEEIRHAGGVRRAVDLILESL